MDRHGLELRTLGVCTVRQVLPGALREEPSIENAYGLKRFGLRLK
jgi:hypothetical protein